MYHTFTVGYNLEVWFKPKCPNVYPGKQNTKNTEWCEEGQQTGCGMLMEWHSQYLLTLVCKHEYTQQTIRPLAWWSHERRLHCVSEVLLKLAKRWAHVSGFKSWEDTSWTVCIFWKIPFINKPLKKESRSYKAHLQKCWGHPESDGQNCCWITDAHLSRSPIFFSLHDLSFSASLSATMSLSTSAWDFLDSSRYRATSCSRSLRRSGMSGHFCTASFVFWVFGGETRHRGSGCIRSNADIIWAVSSDIHSGQCTETIRPFVHSSAPTCSSYGSLGLIPAVNKLPNKHVFRKAHVLQYHFVTQKVTVSHCSVNEHVFVSIPFQGQ